VRLFLAVDPDEAARAGLAALQAGLVRAAADSASALRWVAPAVAHITLHFLGEVATARVDGLVGALGPSASVAPFEIALGAPEVSPPSGPPRVLWMPVARGRAELAALHRELGERVRAAGLSVEARPFTPHLTVARVRDRRGARPLAARVGDVHAPPIRWRIDRATLFESDLSGRTPQYRARHVIGLGSH